MAEKRQEVIFENGVRYRLLGDPDEARLYMRHARMTYDNLDMRNDPLIVDFAHSHHTTSSGASISATRNGHLKEVVIEAYAPAGLRPEKKIIDRKKVNRTYIPAFHTFNKSRNFLGLTLCTSGKWGPPYMFIPCDLDQVLDFESGQWNYEEGTTSPDPEIYKQLRFKSYYSRGKEIIFYDLPASHEYCSEQHDELKTNSYEVAFTGDSERVIVSCGDEEAMGYWKRAKQQRQETLYNSGIAVRTDFSLSPEQELDLIASAPLLANLVNWEVRGNTSSVAAEGETPACSILMENLAVDTTNWEMFFDYGYTGGETIWYIANETIVGDYLYSDILWGDYIGENIKRGVQVYGVSSRDRNYLRRYVGEITVDNFPNVNDVSDDITLSETYTSKDLISVFGKGYLLSEYTVEYDSATGKINECWPRIYEINDDTYIVLTAILRGARTQFEYMCFKDGLEQYNDPEATYQETRPQASRIGCTK